MLLYFVKNAFSIVLPSSLSLFSEKKFRNHGEKSQPCKDFLVHNRPIKQYSSSKYQKVTTVEKCIVLHILKPRKPIVSSDPKVKMCLTYDQQKDI